MVVVGDDDSILLQTVDNFYKSENNETVAKYTAKIFEGEKLLGI